jgi:hypothetical protein
MFDVSKEWSGALQPPLRSGYIPGYGEAIVDDLII